ncbi:MAG: hypothetical protein Q4C71_05710 [Microbacteriaceae bacterium]|nr:hypothetical protein [Microbacteriaceae bacterium]
MRKKLVVTTAALLGVTSLVSGCSGNSKIADFSNNEQISASNYVLAIRTSPQLRDIQENTPGYIALFDEKGNGKQINIGALFRSKMLWNKSGISVGGSDDEISITDSGLTKTPRGSKEAVESARLFTQNDTGFVSIYDAGIMDKKYTTRIRTGNSQSADNRELQGRFYYAALCGDELYGVTLTGYLPHANAEQGSTNAPQEHHHSLVKLTPKPDTDSKPIAEIAPAEIGYSDADTSTGYCVNDNLIMVTNQSKNKKKMNTNVLRKWNTKTGEHTAIELTDKTTKKPLEEKEETSNSPKQFGVKDGFSYWQNRGAVIHKTNIENGETEIFAKPADNLFSQGTARYVLEGNSIFGLYKQKDASAPLQLIKYDLKTGAATKVMEVPGHDGILKDKQFITDFAVRPGFGK